MLPFLKKLVIALFIFSLLTIIIGFLLPRTYTITRNTTIQAPTDTIYKYLSNFEQWQHWSAWHLADPDPKHYSYTGTPATVGSKMAWNSPQNGQGSLTFTALEPPTKAVATLAFVDVAFESSSTFLLEPQGTNSTRVTWTNAGDLGYSPTMRYFGLLMDNLMGADFEKGLNGLKKLCESKNTQH